MAVFFTNICTYADCGKLFATLSELIHHIEQVHLDFEPRVIDEFGDKDLIPFSYVLRYGRNSLATERKFDATETNGSAFFSENFSNRDEKHDYQLLLNRPEACEVSSTTAPFTADFPISHIAHFKRKINGIHQGKSSHNKFDKLQRTYECPVPGCHKKYKNVNGIKYHSKKGHEKKDIIAHHAKGEKDYRCFCGKSYKTAQGLRAHSMLHKSNMFLIDKIKKSREFMAKPSYRRLHLTKYSDDVTNSYDPVVCQFADYVKPAISVPEFNHINTNSSASFFSSKDLNSSNDIFNDNMINIMSDSVDVIDLN